jgi:microcompartment protein CcmL/EutN
VEGTVADVRAAVEAGSEYAKSEGKYIISHVIANPGEGTEKMAYLLDINKDKFNKKLPKNMYDICNSDEPIKTTGESIGLLEVEGLVAAIEGLDVMLKTAETRLVHTEKRLGGRLVTLVLAGNVSAITAAIESGKNAASAIGKVYGVQVIPSPHPEVVKFFDMD